METIFIAGNAFGATLALGRRTACVGLPEDRSTRRPTVRNTEPWGTPQLTSLRSWKCATQKSYFVVFFVQSPCLFVERGGAVTFRSTSYPHLIKKSLILIPTGRNGCYKYLLFIFLKRFLYDFFADKCFKGAVKQWIKKNVLTKSSYIILHYHCIFGTLSLKTEF